MKRNSLIVISFILLVIIAACGTQKDVAIENKQENGKRDSTEYKMIVFDSRFENWYTTYSRPVDYFSESYYESWNYRYVNAWNMSSRDPINYDHDVDYPVAIDHKLFYYFVYVEKIKGDKIIGQSPNAALP